MKVWKKKKKKKVCTSTWPRASISNNSIMTMFFVSESLLMHAVLDWSQNPLKGWQLFMPGFNELGY